jgi:hypothetical protein
LSEIPFETIVRSTILFRREINTAINAASAAQKKGWRRRLRNGLRTLTDGRRIWTHRIQAPGHDRKTGSPASQGGDGGPV